MGEARENSRKCKTDVILEAQKEKRKGQVATLMDKCHLKNAELEPKHQKYKGRVVLRRDMVKDDSAASRYSWNKDRQLRK